MFENVGATGLTKIADKVSASHLVFADKVSATSNKQTGNFVNFFERLGTAFVLVFAVLGAAKIWSDRNPRSPPSPKPPPTSPPRRQRTSPTVSAVAED